MRIDVGQYPVDIYFADENTWATLLLIRTGSAANNIRLCSKAKNMGWHLHADGAGLFNQFGKRMAGDTEASIYEALGLPYQTPAERE
jgi:DNA polymerase (family 10)